MSQQRDPENKQADSRSANKHKIRTAFRHQLSRLWKIIPHLTKGTRDENVMVWTRNSDDVYNTYRAEDLAQRHKLHDWNFVPLVTEATSLVFGLEVLILRPDVGVVIQSGDIV